MTKKQLTILMFILAGAFTVAKAIFQPNLAAYEAPIAIESEPLSFSALVSRVVDGDTVKIKKNGTASSTEDTIRLLGINAPESVDPRIPVQCFGKESSEYLKQMIEGKMVKVITDPTQNIRDKYGRILGYLYLPDDTFVNEKMISDGYAFEYTFITPYRYQTQFKADEKDARLSKSGLWDDAVCNYKENPKKTRTTRRR